MTERVSYEPYEVRLTPLAEAVARKHASIETLEAQVRAELDELLQDGLSSVRSLILHVVTLKPDVHFLVRPRDGFIVVDSSTYEDTGKTLDNGPLKGLGVSIPRADSD